MTNLGMLSTLRHYLKSLKEKWNLWAMALDSSSGQDSKDQMDYGLVSIKRSSQGRNHSTLIKCTSVPNTITIHRILILPPYREIYFSTTTSRILSKSTVDGNSEDLH